MHGQRLLPCGTARLVGEHVSVAVEDHGLEEQLARKGREAEEYRGDGDVADCGAGDLVGMLDFWELDALDPDVLVGLIEESIQRYMDRRFGRASTNGRT